jgi:hypothetical protein
MTTSDKVHPNNAAIKIKGLSEETLLALRLHVRPIFLGK